MPSFDFDFERTVVGPWSSVQSDELLRRFNTGGPATPRALVAREGLPGGLAASQPPYDGDPDTGHGPTNTQTKPLSTSNMSDEHTARRHGSSLENAKFRY